MHQDFYFISSNTRHRKTLWQILWKGIVYLHTFSIWSIIHLIMAEIKISYIHISLKIPTRKSNRDTESKMKVRNETSRRGNEHYITAMFNRGARSVSSNFRSKELNEVTSSHTGFTESERRTGGRERGEGRGRGRETRCTGHRRTGTRRRCSRPIASGNTRGHLASRSHSHGRCGSLRPCRLENKSEGLALTCQCAGFRSRGRRLGMQWLEIGWHC